MGRHGIGRDGGQAQNLSVEQFQFPEIDHASAFRWLLLRVKLVNSGAIVSCHTSMRLRMMLQPRLGFYVVAVACTLVTSSAWAESWREVYAPTTYGTSGLVREVDVDSVELSGELVKYRARDVLIQRNTFDVMVADCTRMTRGQWHDLRMYPVYPETKGGDEVKAVCEIARRSRVALSSDPSRPTDRQEPRDAPRLSGSTAPRFPPGFDCNKLTNEDSRATCNSSASQLPTPSPNISSFSRQFDCSRLTNDNARNACMAQQGAPEQTAPPTVSIAPAPAHVPAPRQQTQTFAPPPVPRVVSTGSGFIVGAGSIVTNHHVVEDCATVSVRFGNSISPAKVSAVTVRNDLALLTSTRPFGYPAAIRNGAALGEDVTVSGYPLSGLLSNDLIVTSGQVNSLAGLANDPTMLQVSAPIQPGNSGGPLLDRSGAIVGVVVSKLNVERLAKLTGDMAQNVNFAIKPELLRLFLDTNRVQYRSASIGQRLDGIVLAERARGFTVQVLCEK